MTAQQLDEIGPWSEIKLQIVREYAKAYSTILSTQRDISKHLYIDGFAGIGKHYSRTTRTEVPGSPAIALSISPQFSEYHFIDLDGHRADSLRQLAGDRPNAFVHHGDSNKILLQDVFPRCRYEDRARALCLLDPYSLNVNWQVLAAAGQSKAIEIFFNFMIMDANMNVWLKHPSKIAPEQAARMTKAWGDNSWRDVGYDKVPSLFPDMEIEEKRSNEARAEAFRQRLRDVAGFKYVPKPLAMKNGLGRTVYYLYFASPKEVGHRIVQDIFRKHR